MRRYVEQKYYLLNLFIGVAGNGVLGSWKDNLVNVGGSEFLTAGHSHCDLHCAAACFPSSCVPGYSFLSLNSCYLWNWTWKDVVSIPFVLPCLLRRCQQCRLIEVWKMVTTGIACGSLTQDVEFCCLKDDFWRFFLHPNANGLTQDELSQTSADYSV